MFLYLLKNKDVVSCVVFKVISGRWNRTLLNNIFLYLMVTVFCVFAFKLHFHNIQVFKFRSYEHF